MQLLQMSHLEEVHERHLAHALLVDQLEHAHPAGQLGFRQGQQISRRLERVRHLHITHTLG